MTEHIPKNMRLASATMSNYNRNRFKLMATSGDTSGPHKPINVNLPEMALIDSKSLKLHMDVATTSATVNTKTVYGRLPADVSSLVSRVEVFLNGIQLQGSLSEYNTAARILKIGRCSRDKDGSIDRALSHGAVVLADAVEDVSLVMSDFIGFLGENSARYLDTSLLGQLSVRLTFAGNEVLVPREHGVDLATDLHADAITAAGQITYSVSNIYFTCDSIQIDEMYQKMLRQRLATEEYIPIRYKDYYSFSLDGSTTDKHSVRFSLSSASIDKMYAVCRDGNFSTTGVRGFQMAAVLSDNLVSNALRFKSFNSSTTKMGTLKYNFTVNNVMTPQYQADIREGLFDLAYCNDKVYGGSSGHLVTSLEQYNDGMFVVPLMLNHPGESVAVRSGLDSRGINTMCTFSVSGQVPPTVTASQTTDSISTYILVECTSELRVGLGKMAVVDA